MIVVAGAEDAPPGGTAPARAGGNETKQTPKRHLLVMEDDYFIGLLSEEWLLAAGYEVVGVVATEHEAFAAAARHRPDLVVMDIRLAEGGNGVAAAIELFHKLGIRSLFASAHFDDAVKARAAEAQPLGWIAKPFTEAHLSKAVAVALLLRDRGQQL
jgi:CheY-like chemotaxis protein